jgi:threonine dehydrogenase-like Zn-dependent dehydrogenase
MRAIQVSGPGALDLVEAPEPRPAAGETLIRVIACGVCASDQNVWQGVAGISYPLSPGAPGHEVYGEVIEAVPPGSAWPPGQHVTGLAWNGLAERTLARTTDLVPVASNNVVLGEPLACAVRVVERAQLRPADRLVFLGFGYLAALCAQLLPPDVAWTAIARRAESRELARQLGATDTYDFEAIPDALWDRVPVVIEATGAQRGLDLATRLLGVDGRLVIAGYHADGWRTVNMQSWNWKGLDVVNAHERSNARLVVGLRHGLELMQTRQLDLTRLLSHAFSLSNAAAAFAAGHARPAGFLKAVVYP